MIVRGVRKWKGKGARSKRWNLERLGIAVAIVVGISTAIASVVATLYAGQQAELARQALSVSERNAAFVKYIDAMGRYCDALDFSDGRAEMTWTFSRQSALYTVLAYYKDIGTQFQTEAALGTAHVRLRTFEASAIPLRIWLDTPSVDFIERTLHELKKEFFVDLGKSDGRPKPARLYLAARARCLGVRKVLMAWYRHTNAWPFDSATKGAKVQLMSRPHFQ